MHTHRTLLLTIFLIFGIISVLHLLRLAFGIPAFIGGFPIPLWVSGLATIVAGFLAYRVSRLLK